MLTSAIVSGLAASAIYLYALVWREVSRLKRSYVAKSQVLDELIASLRRTSKSLADEQVEVQRKGAILAELIHKAKPLIDQLDKRY